LINLFWPDHLAANKPFPSIINELFSVIIVSIESINRIQIQLSTN
jgi:hypothetical protein